MNKSFVKRRRKMRRKLKSMNISQRVLRMSGIILGFVLAVCFGVMAGKIFGTKVMIDGSAMMPAFEENEALRVNKMIYKLRRPGRMDVVVFDMAKGENSRYFVRRVVGLPGETVQIIEGQLYIDDQPLDFKYNEEYIVDAGLAKEAIRLGQDEYFVLGDNYNHCDDSRFGAIGIVKKDQIVGKAG